MNTLLVVASVLLLFAAACPAIAQDASSPRTLHSFTVRDIDGKDVELSRYKGKVVLVVNVASRCGYTPQYRQLQEVYEKYKDKGLAILGFPANQFGGQEPGSDVEIKGFCTSKYNVSFDMFSKVVVKGKDIAPLYQWLTDKEGKFGGDVKWNFTKFLIGKDGHIIGRFEPGTRPDDPKVIDAIEAAIR